MKWFWAFLLIAIGILYLGPIFSLWSGEQANQIWEFWPLLLVLFGLNLVVKNYRGAWLVMLVSFLVAALFVYGASAKSGSNLAQKKQEKEKEQSPKESSFSVGAPSELDKVVVEINTGAIEMNLSGGSEKLVEGKLTSSFAEPKLETKISDKTANVKLSTATLSKGITFQNLKNVLNMKLGSRVPTEVKIDSGASSMNLDFSNVLLSGLDLNTGASSIDVKVSDSVQKDARLDFEAGASDINIEYQKGLGVRIESDSGLAKEDFEGFTKKDGVFENAEYEKAEKKITIVLRTGASSVDIKSY